MGRKALLNGFSKMDFILDGRVSLGILTVRVTAVLGMGLLAFQNQCAFTNLVTGLFNLVTIIHPPVPVFRFLNSIFLFQILIVKSVT